jgi:hypothetical protein
MIGLFGRWLFFSFTLVLMPSIPQSSSTPQSCWWCSNFMDPEWGAIHQDYEEPESSITSYCLSPDELHFPPYYGEEFCCHAHQCPSPGDPCWPIIAEDLTAPPSALAGADPIVRRYARLLHSRSGRSYPIGRRDVE